MASRTIRLSDYIRSIPDFPKEGILFRDITPLLADAKALAAAIDELARPFRFPSTQRAPGQRRPGRA